MKIAFFGLPLAALCLRRDGHDVRLAVISPVAAPGMRRLRRALHPTALLDASEFTTEALGARVARELDAIRPDLIVSWYWTRRVAAEWLCLATRGGIGVHPSLLPRHRGPNPFFWAIDCGDIMTGVSVHWLEEEYDAGNVIVQRQLAIENRDSWQLARALDRVSLAALRDCVAQLERGEELEGQAQDAGGVTWASEPTGSLLKLDPRWDVERALRRIRALAPVPGLPISVRGLELFLTRARAAPHAGPLLPGEAAVWPGLEPRLLIAVASGALSVERAILVETGEDLDGPSLAARVAILPPDPP